MFAEPDLPLALHSTTADQRAVMLALALGATHRARTWIYGLLGEMGARNSEGKRFTSEQVRDLIRELREAGVLSEHPQRAGFWQLAEGPDAAMLDLLLDRPDRDALLQALLATERAVVQGGFVFHTPDAAVAVLRLELFSGKPLREVEARWRSACRWNIGWDEAVGVALLGAQQPALLKRLHPSLQGEVVAARLQHVLASWQPDRLPLVEMAQEQLASGALADELPLRMLLAEYLICGGRAPEAAEVVQPLREAQATGDAAYRQALAQAVDAALVALQGRWAEAEAAYEPALAALRKETKQRKAVLPLHLMLPYVQSLLAQQTPAHLDKALKLCLAEAGQRRPTADSAWGLIALALQMRKGEMPRDPSLFAPYLLPGHVSQLDVIKWLMRAWLKEDAAPQPLAKGEQPAADALLARLKASGLHWLQAQCEDALNLLAGRAVRPTFFVPAAQEGWRVALAALASIAAPVAAEPRAAEGAPESRLVWVMALGAAGEVEAIVPHEQKRGARGWNRPQPVSLWKVSQMVSLPPHDAKVVRSIKSRPYGSTRDMTIDLAAAVAALVDHPAVELADQPGVAITLVEGTPELEVADAGETLRLSVRPPLRDAAVPAWTSVAEKQAIEALASTTVLRDGPQRARVVRFTPAQRRAALLLGSGLAVPKGAMSQLQPVLQGLGAHFQVHADTAAAARDVPADSRLRAELTPLGDGFRLRLAAAPLGPDGPRLVPGHGRPRMIAAVRGETVAVQRDLEAERRHLGAVLDACPQLAAAAIGEAEYALDEADDALAVIETLPRLQQAVAALDWPAGRAVSVASAGLGQLGVQVRSQRDWLAVDGGIQIDEALVLGLAQLLQWHANGRGRFVPLGEGRYLALTQELRARIADLAAVAELQQGQVKLPPLAAGWLDSALDGMAWEADPALRERLDRLVRARELQPKLPSTLQAELRPYQHDGYQWAMRLAAAGCGACLADDMGLGKTLQALAVLLARAADGPALVAAPTSLIGNWLAEARRFAPSLNLQVYGDGSDREGLLAAAGPRDVVLVSYPLLQLNAEAFAAREWHTLVLDEAQALKNAAAKRTQAAQSLQAGFTLALSGTPIENRLAELWSVMRLCNPGLLGSLARFNERFALPIERDRDREAQRRLRRLISPFILRRTKAEVLDDLPPRTELALTVQPEPAERAHYEALRRQAVAEAERSAAQGGGQAQISILAQLMRLRRAACDPRLVSPELGMAGAKVQAFAALAEELAANGHKALVFSQFVDFLALLREPLDAAGIPYQYLDGATPAAERTRRVAAFQAGEGALFLISLKAGGFGLNLTVADYVVIADPWWNPAAEDQASGRAHRIGQQRPVTVYRLVQAGTLEERIVELHQRKRELAEGVLDGADASGPLQAEELLALMRG